MSEGTDNIGTRLQPLLVDAKGVCQLLGIGLSCLYAMDRTGELGPQGLKPRRRRLWPREELAAWVKAGCPRREIWMEKLRNSC